jgi:uncharacterized protein (TIGR02099 family)
MHVRWLQRLRRAHHGVAYLVTGMLVLMALVGLAATQILPLAERHPDRVAGWLSDRAGRPVRFDAVDTQWTRRGPLLKLANLRIGSGVEEITIGDAEMLVSQYSGLLPGRSFTELRVRNLDLTLERETGGRWRVRGLPGQQRPGADPLASLQRLGELQVIGAKLHVVAPSLGLDTRVPQVHLRLRVEGDRVRAGVRAWMRPGGTPVDAVFDFDRKAGDGQAWIASRRTELAQWSPLLRYAGVSVEAGGGRAQAWAKLRAHRVVGVFADLALQRVELQGEAARPGAAPPRVRLDRVRGRLQWATVDGGWRLDTPLLEFADGAGAPRVQRVTVAGGSRNVLLAARIDAAPLIAVASLSDRLAPGLRGWLQVARPAATLTDIRAVGARGGALQVSGRLADAGFQPVAGAPGLRGLGGELLGDADALDFRFDPGSAVIVDWPRGFGVAHRMSLRGSIVGWREGAGWRTETSSLSVRGSNYGVDLRGGLWFQGDGTRPRMDLAANVGPAPVVAAKGFWLRHGMPAAAVRWLDTALLGGTVQGGRALVSGDLDDWPFRSRDGQPANGVFHAAARIRDAVVKFQPEWPAAEHMDAEVDFIADGFRVRGQRASIAGVTIGSFDAGIEHFGRAVLTVDANAATDASRLLDLLRQSPLRKAHGETLANIEASGPARVEFGLQLPLHRGAPPSAMQGTVALQRARLSEKRWDLAFADVSGSARYGQGGFDADALEVVHQGRPGRLALRAGEYVRDARQAFEAELDAQLSAEDLFDRAPDLRWLRPRISGTSAWTLAVGVPKAGASPAAPSRLQLRSNLVGTALTLPAPLDKPASIALPTTVDVALPLGEGEVAVAFGNRLALRARSRGGQTGVRVVLGASRIDAAPPSSGLVATGRSDRLDVIDWAALTRGSDPAPAITASSTSSATTSSAATKTEGVPLRSVDVTVAGLQLIGASFPNTRLRAVPAAGGTAVRLDGAALSGAFMLPQSAAAPIAGRFERLHWRAAGKAVTDGAAAATVPSIADERAPAVDDTDPSKVPPLILAIDDLRFGDARLGTASLRTQPVAAGMRIVHLQTRAKGQSIDISGDWLRRTGSMQTRLDGRWKSDDFGAMLGAFDFRQISKGKGEVGLRAQWPGSPATLRLADLAGDMRLDLRDGQLVEVEPGAGRVLGLLSVAQLPRRLAFDFRDFFDKGFAFNKISGQVHFGGGNARSNDLNIDGPAAEIRIRGAADLRAQTYDQTIDVFPRAGNLLTVAGAIAGGPVGAAIGAAANAVLNKPLGQLAAKSYRVTGPWKDPKVETVSRGNAATAPKEPPG